MNGPTDPPSTGTGDADLDRRIAAALARARAAALVEGLWREAIVPLWIFGLLVGLAWVGVRGLLPGPAGAAIVWGLAALGVAASVRAVVRGRAIVARATARAAAVARVERESGLAARDLSDLDDRLAAGAADPATAALWAAHRRRLATGLGPLSGGPPRPDLGRRDRWALRPALGLLLFVGWFAALGDHVRPLLDAFASGIAPSPADRIDVWIEPPLHTGLPVVSLVVDGAATDGTTPTVRAPVGSRLVVRASPGVANRPVRTIEARATPPESLGAVDEPAPAAVPGAPVDVKRVLRGDGRAVVTQEGREILRLDLRPQPDRPPTIAFADAPDPNGRGGLRLAYEVGDDFGVASAEARLVPSPGRGRPLWDPPVFALTLPSGARHVGRAETVRDLSAHPFAGARVAVELSVTDGAGQVGRAEPATVRLPARVFRDPLAAALAELRRRLALDAGEIGTVTVALDALTLAPERFGTRPGTHLGLRHLAALAGAARSDDDLRRLADEMWAMASILDAGDTLDEQKALEAARQALADALRNGASDEEIARLTRELKQAMERYLKALAETGRRDPSGRPSASGEGRRIDRQSLSRRLDEIEKLARTGSRAAAERLLAELGDTLDRLRAGRAGGEGGGGQALGDMIRRQRDLMDRTHRAERQGADAGERERLLSEQRALRDELRRMRGANGEGEPSTSEGTRGGRGGGGTSGGDPGAEGRDGGGDSASGEGGDGEDPLAEADRAMDEASGALDRGEGADAVDAQARAIDGLRRGARAAAEGGREGGERAGRGGEGDGEEDPFGRPRRSRNLDGARVGIPETIDVERARRILDDIRRRLGDPDRPSEERDYLDRLLEVD